MPVSVVKHALAVLAALFALGACSGPASDQVVHETVPPPDAFASVSAVLEVKCGTLDCHGSSARNMRVYGIDGLRLDPMGTTGDQSTTDDEVLATYSSVVSVQPEVLARVFHDGGRQPERWLPVAKGRELQEHKGGRRLVAGDDADACITSWLTSTVDEARCATGATVGPPGGEAF
jgi:hypothetical protein